MKKRSLTTGCGLALASTALAGLGLGGVAGAADRPVSAAERPVIVEVAGDAAGGFKITYADGASTYPPTGSEARAECLEYDTGLARVRCRVEARTWYRDLGDLQRSLAHVRGSAN